MDARQLGAALDGFEDYYGIDHPNLRAFLATLGLQTYEGAGADKPAWHSLMEETAESGF